ncbi:MAG: MoaD/ThiS family protein [Clostridiales Family XIII bacterium]|jgi:molybdopterin converting factor small subunit|nr:MoaD/ThiS family protein [Clostridiales Family XIII bacterium]
MKVNFEFVGMLRKFNNWQNRSTFELPDGCTAKEAMAKFEAEAGFAKEFGFITIGGKKHADNDVTLKDGDTVKIFPKSFGG